MTCIGKHLLRNSKRHLFIDKIGEKHKLPIVIHVRNAFNETIKIVEELNDSNLTGVFHCLQEMLTMPKE